LSASLDDASLMVFGAVTRARVTNNFLTRKKG